MAKRSPAKATLPGPKQVDRCLRDGVMVGDVVALADEALEGRALLTPAMRNGRSSLRDSLSDLRARATAGLTELPAPLRRLDGAPPPQPYPVTVSPALLELAERGGGRAAALKVARGWRSMGAREQVGGGRARPVLPKSLRLRVPTGHRHRDVEPPARFQ